MTEEEKIRQDERREDELERKSRHGLYEKEFKELARLKKERRKRMYDKFGILCHMTESEKIGRKEYNDWLRQRGSPEVPEDLPIGYKEQEEYEQRKEEQQKKEKEQQQKEFDAWFDSLTEEEQWEVVREKVKEMEVFLIASANLLKDCGVEENKQALEKLSVYWDGLESVMEHRNKMEEFEAKLSVIERWTQDCPEDESKQDLDQLVAMLNELDDLEDALTSDEFKTLSRRLKTILDEG